MQDELMDGQMNIVPPWFLHEISGTKANTMELDLNKRYEKVESLAIIRKKIPSLSFDTYYSLYIDVSLYLDTGGLPCLMPYFCVRGRDCFRVFVHES